MTRCLPTPKHHMRYSWDSEVTQRTYKSQSKISCQQITHLSLRERWPSSPKCHSKSMLLSVTNCPQSKLSLGNYRRVIRKMIGPTVYFKTTIIVSYLLPVLDQ